MTNFLFSWESENAWVYPAYRLQYMHIYSSSAPKQNLALLVNPGTNRVGGFFWPRRRATPSNVTVKRRKINKHLTKKQAENPSLLQEVFFTAGAPQRARSSMQIRKKTPHTFHSCLWFAVQSSHWWTHNNHFRWYFKRKWFTHMSLRFLLA